MALTFERQNAGWYFIRHNGKVVGDIRKDGKWAEKARHSPYRWGVWFIGGESRIYKTSFKEAKTCAQALADDLLND